MLDADVQADIADYLAFQALHTNTTTGEADSAVSQFTAFDLSASEFEALNVLVDGQETNLNPGVELTYGDYESYGYVSATADGGAGDDAITFGDYAAYDSGYVSADGGVGNDTIVFGSGAGSYNGSVTVDGGAGADTFIFGNNALNLTIDLGAGGEDSETFQGSVHNTTIDNWESGFDVVSVVNKDDWSGVDNGTDTIFTNGNQEITFLDVTGLTIDDFLM